MISPAYAEQNRKLHQTNEAYGTSSRRWVLMVQKIAAASQSASVLDYGAGKGLLGEALASSFDWREYDPAMEGKGAMPERADLVVCTDVLEHVEPDCLEAVLDDLKRLSGKMVFLTIATRPAGKTLPDGRNAHLIVEDHVWWLPKLAARFGHEMIEVSKGEIVFVGRPR